MEILGFEPKAFPMRKGCSTTELHPLHSLFSFVLHSKLHSLGFWKKFWKTDEIKMEILGLEPKAFPMRKRHSTTELHPLHSLLFFVLQSKLHCLGFWKRFWKTDEIIMEILGFEPKAFTMPKGHSTTELHPLHSLLSFVLQSKLLSLGLWIRFWKTDEIKMEILGFEHKAFPMQKGHSTTELHPLHSLLSFVLQSKLHSLGSWKRFWKTDEIKMEILGFEPKAFPMRKGRSTTELHPLHSLFSFVLQSSLHSLGFWKRFWKMDEMKMEIMGFEPKAFPMRKGHSTTELHPLHSLVSFVLQSKLLSLGFWKRFWKTDEIKWRYWDSN
jgi:hypothetical protein